MALIGEILRAVEIGIRSSLAEGLTRAATASLLRDVGFSFANVEFNRLFAQIRKEVVIVPQLNALGPENPIPRAMISNGYQTQQSDYMYRVGFKGINPVTGQEEIQWVTVGASRVLTPAEIQEAAFHRIQLSNIVGRASGVATAYQFHGLGNVFVRPSIRYGG